MAGTDTITIGRLLPDAHYVLLHNITRPSNARPGCLPYVAWTFLEPRAEARHSGRQASLPCSTPLLAGPLSGILPMPGHVTGLDAGSVEQVSIASAWLWLGVYVVQKLYLEGRFNCKRANFDAKWTD